MHLTALLTRTHAMTARLRAVAAAALAALALGAPAALRAQASSTTGAIRGTVTAAEAKTPLAGATVTAVNTETGFTRNALTEDDGIFVARFLPPGTYRVTARRIGYQPATLENIRVTVGATSQASIGLREAAVQPGAVQVSAEAQRIDVADAGVKTTVTTEEITSLPSLGRDFTDFINLSGLVSPTPETTTGGQFSIAGQRPSQTNVQIDGVDANNSFFGENRGGSRIPFAFSLESIREFQIITNGYDVEYGNYSGGLINIVTRGGTNRFKGSAYGNFRNKDLTAKDFEGNAVNNFSVQQYAGSVEGPILKDKLFYLFSADGQRRREPFRSVSADFYRGGRDTTLADSLTRFFDILQSKYGIRNPGSAFGEFETSNDVITLFGRLDWTISDKHRLSLRDNYSNYKNGNESGTFNAGLSQAETIKDNSNSLVSELTSTLGSKAFNTLRMQYASEGRPRTPNSRLPEIHVNLTSSEVVEYGGSFLSFQNNLDEKKFQVVDNLTWTLGKHGLKFGTNNTFTNIDNVFWLNGSGGYEFANLAALEALTPSRYSRNVRADSTTPTASFGAQEYSAYAQDDWQLTPKLLVSAGLRYDIARYGETPGRVIDVERALGFKTGIAPIDDNNISPRLALTYDLKGDGSQVIRAGGGLFYGRVPYVLGSNVQITDRPLLVIDCRGSTAENAPDAPPTPDFPDWAASGASNPFTCARGAAASGTPEYSFWHQGFEIPETWKANVGYERLLFRRTRLKLDALYSTSSKLYTVRNLNLRDPIFTLDGEGGRQVFVPQSAFAPASAASSARLRNTQFANVYVNYNDGASESFAGTAELEHRLTNRSTAKLSYTYMRAYDNGSFSCCTSNEGYRNARVGALGPNVIGERGDESAAWGPSDFVRKHTVVLSGIMNLPWQFRLSAFWRMQSGVPWMPEQGGDLNGDGERFNDRPFIFKPSELPVSVGTATGLQRDSIIGSTRARYASYLNQFECIGKYVGKIIPRNSCENPWFNRLDMSLRKKFTVAGDQGAELQIDLFNVLNGLNSKWGRYRAVTGANRDLMVPVSYNAGTNQVEYTVPTNLGLERTLGSGLLLQFSAQVGARIYF